MRTSDSLFGHRSRRVETHPRPHKFSEGTDDLAEDLKAEFGANRRVGLVAGLQVELFGRFVVGQELHGEVVINDGHHNFARLGWCALLDHDDVAFKQAGVFH